MQKTRHKIDSNAGTNRISYPAETELGTSDANLSPFKSPSEQGSSV